MPPVRTFLHDYLGMYGIPIELRAEFPEGVPVCLLTEAAKADPDIVPKIEKQVRGGNTVVMTSGLFKALQDRGIRRIVEINVTDRKASVQDFLIGWFGQHHAESPVLFPHLEYVTNDAWEEVSGLTQTTGHPVFTSDAYGKGSLYVLTIPDNFDDIYKLPQGVMARIKQTLCADMPVSLDSPAQVMLFIYDNDTVIVESILDEAVDVDVVTGEDIASMIDLQSGENL